MEYVVLGTMGTLVCFLIDFVTLREIPFLKQIIEVVSSFVTVYSLVMLCLDPEKIPLASWLSYLGWIGLTISLFLLFWSLFWEIPFQKTYVATQASRTLIDTGTFALTRHPEVLWCTSLLCSLFLISGGKLLLVAAPIWIILVIVRVSVMEKVYLEQVFGEAYRRYQEQTPMIVPTRSSLDRCVKTLKVKRGT